MKYVLFALAVLIAVLVAVFHYLTSCRKGHPAWQTLKKYRYAHRGCHDKPAVPENSMEAFRRAVERGFGAELDVHLMKDGTLAVIHDASLKRTAGAEVKIEDLTVEELKNYHLEESEETIPLFDDVLALFEKKTPLIIELKVERENYAALSEAVARRLDSYTGDYCIESFDPRAVSWFRKHRPDTCRGQLSQNFFRDQNSKLPGILKFLMTNLLVNVIARPDFVAYNHQHRHGLAPWWCRKLHGAVEFCWTVTDKEAMERLEEEKAGIIFERFDPEG